MAVSYTVASFAVLSDEDPAWRPGHCQRELLGSFIEQLPPRHVTNRSRDRCPRVDSGQ
ncbi:MAG: hypothetical protein KDE31_36510 [Caldilineaceae bacterium]|nr:hypothetical protein [Caldilineaceae bacterium]